MIKSAPRSLPMVATALLLAVAGPRLGMVAEPTSTPEATGGVLSEIIVTAQKRSEELNKVPMSVTAIDVRTLVEQGAKGIDDVARLVPGLNLRANDYLGDPTISIRGITSNAGSATTGIYLDEAPIQTRNNDITTSNAYPKIFDLERVEALRGPQGTLYGAGSEGGTLRFITPAPSLSGFSGYAHAEGAMTDNGDPSAELGVALGGPLVEGTVGFRASAWHRRDGGYIDRLSPQTGAILDRRANSGTTDVARLAVRFQLNDRFSVTPAVFYQKSTRHDQDLSWEDAGPRQALYALPSPITDRFVLPSLDVEWNLDRVTVRSITSYFDRSAERFADATAFDLSGLLPDGAIAIPGNPDYVANSFYRNSQRNWTEEVRFTSNESPADRWSWVAGLYYQKNEQGLFDWYAEPLGTVTAYLDTLTTPNVCQDPETGLSFGPTVVDCFGVDLIDGIYSGIQDLKLTETDKAVFGNVSYKIRDDVTAKVGLRVARSRYEFTDHQDGPYTGGPVDASGSKEETPVTPMASLSYQATSDTLLYGTAAKGYRIGGANESVAGNPACAADLQVLGLQDVPAGYNSDSLWSYEIGAKGRFAGQFALDASVYWIEWDKIQQLVLLPTCGYYYTDNLGHARSRGMDLQAGWAVNSQLTLSGTLGYTDVRYTETVAPSGPVLVAQGDRLPTPQWTATFSAQYRFAVAGAQAYIRGDYQYAGAYERSGSPETFSYDPTTSHQGATNYATMRTGAKFANWEVAAFINNVFNSQTSLYRYHDTVDSPGYRNFTFRPRTGGITVDYRF